MKKLILSISLLIFFFVVFPSNTYAALKQVCQDQYDSAMRSCLLTCKSSPERDRCEKSCYTIQGNVRNNCLGFPITTPSQNNKDCLDEKLASQAKCGDAHKTCIDACPGAQGIDLGPLSDCLSKCSSQQDSCDTATLTVYKSCTESEKKDQEQVETKQNTKAQEQPKTGSIPVFIGDWFKTVSGAIWLHDWAVDIEAILFTGQNTQELANTEKALKYIDSITDEYAQFATGQTKDQLEELLDREPDVTDEVVNQLRQKTHDSPYVLDILKGQAQIKYPGQNSWVDLKEGDKIPTGSTIFTGMDTTTVLNIQDKGVIEVLSFTELTISEKGLEQAAKESKTTTDIRLKTGEIEVNVDQYFPSSGPSGSQGWGMSIYGPYYSAAIRGTHFWVKQEKEKQFTTVGVYKGTVEVKPKGSDMPAIITPNGNKPGMIIISQKLSTTKLVIAGLAFVAVLIGIIFLAKIWHNKNKRKK